MVVRKLVRDRIPELANGTATFTQVVGVELVRALIEKLREECEEVAQARNSRELTEEISDVVAVLRAIAAQYHIDWEEVIAVEETKRRRRGGFVRGFYMNKEE